MNIIAYAGGAGIMTFSWKHFSAPTKDEIDQDVKNSLSAVNVRSLKLCGMFEIYDGNFSSLLMKIAAFVVSKRSFLLNAYSADTLMDFLLLMKFAESSDTVI